MHLRPLLAALALMTLATPALAQSRLPMTGFADLAERLTPAVVNIATSQRVEPGAETPRFPPGSPLERFNQGLAQNSQVTSLGSGFIISADGVIVTNNHVISEADTIEVILQNNQHLPATVVGRDPATDIAVLRVHARNPLPFVRFGDSDAARVGDLVLAIGNPFGLGGSLSVGVVSARNRNIDAGRYDDFIQTDAAINRGNSGGPLFNVNGDVIGMNTAILSPSGGSVGIGFATPASIVQPVVAQILRYGEIRRGWLGVRLSDVGDENSTQTGALITRITPNGPASAAGLRVGDVVLKFGNRAVPDSRSLTRMIGDAQIGAAVPIDIMRNGRRMTVPTTIQRLQEGAGQTRASNDEGGGGVPRTDGGARGGRVFGVSLNELDAGLREEYQIDPNVRGLVVVGADIGGANDGVLRPGDVIEAMAFQHVETLNAARAIASRASIGERSIVVRVNRAGAITYRRLQGRS
ncbi:MAG: trypsin-like peptidase domain-containing protein [Proteobacteria bacterium]|nr:trypsin-like peptidase domain-containing protein [Pseudomonadota bacterium]